MTTASPTATAAGETLLRLLDARAPHDAITSHLDGLGAEERLAQVRALGGKRVARLYEAMADAPPLALEEIVPANEKGTRIFQGRNSLPMFSDFQKRFQRTASGTIVGYNHQTMAFVTGPGFFVVKGPSGDGPRPNEAYFDYTEAPPEVPAGWPAFKPNDRGFSKAVYANMKDYMRRVARGVMVGEAYKLGVAQSAWFVLALRSA